MSKWLIYFDDELKVYRFVMKDNSQAEVAARANFIRKWAVQNGFPELAGKKGRLPDQVVRSYFGVGGNNE
jgi:hypothetical protein